MTTHGKGVLKRLPKGYYFVDCARSLTQARDIVKAYRGYSPKIVSTPSYKVFPYHIAVPKNRR